MTKKLDLDALEAMGRKLTRKQRRFCHAHVKHGNGARAAREAGYSHRTAREMAHENLTKPHIADYIEALEADSFDVNKLTPEHIQKMLLDDAMNAKEGGTRLRAKELLGKAKGMFKDVVINETQELSNAQLIQLVGELFGPDLAQEAANRMGLESDENQAQHQ